MSGKLTNEIAESFLDCKYKGYLKFIGMRGEISEFERIRIEDRNFVHNSAIQKFTVRCKDKNILSNFKIAPRALREGPHYFFNAITENDQLLIYFDILEKVPVESKLGNFHYIPILFHEAEYLSQKQRLLLEIYGLILGSLQGKKPDYGIILHGQSCQSEKTKLRLSDGIARRKLQELREIQSGKQPRLILNLHCPICEFGKHCYAEMKEKDDLSLLKGLSEKEILKHNKKGIFTVTQLSYSFRPRKRPKNSMQKPPPRQHALQALAIRENKIFIHGSPELPVYSNRIYLDLEGDLDRRFVYLLGMIVQTGDKEERYSFWADTPAEESLIYQQFLKVIEQYETFQIYTYGRYESNFLKRMVKHTEQKELAEKTLNNLTNILKIIYSYVYFPVYTNSLKDIAKFLGFDWTEKNASGIQSVVWRRNWELTGSSAFKNKLLNYNMEDCAALKKVADFLYWSCNPVASDDKIPVLNHLETDISRVKDISPQWNRRQWCKANFVIPDFDIINKCAYYDYQRQKVYVRSSKMIKKSQTLDHKRKYSKKNLRPTQRVEIDSQECPFCGEMDLIRRSDARLSRIAYDLNLSRSGIKRKVIRAESSWHWCKHCGSRFLPRDYLRLDEYFHSLKSYAIYENVVHRNSFSGIAEKIREYFEIPINGPDVSLFKKSFSQYYDVTYQLLLEKIVTGSVIHADETQIHTRQTGKGYVWVFTNLEEVIFLYRKTREGEFLKDLLKNFKGVLVSDFYSAYDSLDCLQQKCLIHLIRDFNHDLQSNPWDEELKLLADQFGKLLRKIVATVDQFGLKRRYLI